MRILLAIVLAALGAGCSRDAAPEPDSASGRDAGVLIAEAGALAPTTAVDPQGEGAYAAWFGRDERGEHAIFAAHLRPGTSGIPSAVLVDLGDHRVNVHAQAPPQVAVSPDGSVLVAWTSNIPVEGRPFPASHVLLSRSTDRAGTFEPAVLVNDDAGGPPAGHTFHDLAVGPDGVVYVSWLDTRGGAEHLEPSADRDPAGAGPFPETHAGADHAAASNTTVRVARSEDGGRTFSPSVIVARGTCQCCRTSLAVADDGTVYAAWRHIYATNVRDIAVSHSADGGRTFSEPVRVHADGWAIDGCPHNGPSIAAGVGGDVRIAWYTGAEMRAGLYTATSGDGGRSFDRPRALFRGASGASVRLATSERSLWRTWEEHGTVHLARGERVLSSFPGSSPSLAAGGVLISLVWQHPGGIRSFTTMAAGTSNSAQ